MLASEGNVLIIKTSITQRGSKMYRTAAIIDDGTLDTVVVNIFEDGELIDTVRVDSDYSFEFEDDIDFLDNVLDLYGIEYGV